MPQLKKISVLSSNLLPKVESVYSNYNPDQDISTYLPIYHSETRSSLLLTSEAESDGGDSIPSKPRKRQRLDHLSQEEKIMRRKMKNRVAAQTARDRKKARMAELEEQVVELETERKMLLLANMNLQSENETLQKENAELKLRLGQNDQDEVKLEKESSPTKESKTVDAESRVLGESRSIEHAEGTGSANSYSLDDAIHLFASNSETDALLDLLEQCSESLLQCEDVSTPVSNCGESRKNGASVSEMVGTSSKSLEPHKELIHFDHIYYKQEDEASDPVPSPLLCSELSTKDCSSMDILSPLEEDCVIEVDNSSEIPVICISEAPDTEPPSEVLHFDSFSYPQFDDQILSSDNKPVPSPISSDGGYDSSFSVASPCSGAGNPWDDTLTELFPSLV